MTIDTTVLIVPGLREHVPEHWQTLLAAKLPRVHTVPPLEQDKLSCAARVEALDRALRAIDGPVILVAHSAGVMMVAHWAQATPVAVRSRARCWPRRRTWRPVPGGLSDHGHAARARLAADSAPSAAVPEPGRGQPQRSAVRLRRARRRWRRTGAASWRISARSATSIRPRVLASGRRRWN